MLCFRLKTLVDQVLRPRFAAAGLHPGERVAALLPNGPQVFGVEKLVLKSQIQIASYQILKFFEISNSPIASQMLQTFAWNFSSRHSCH